jgi:hypothetical protein
MNAATATTRFGFVKHRRRRRRIVALAGSAAVLALAACGGGDFTTQEQREAFRGACEGRSVTAWGDYDLMAQEEHPIAEVQAGGGAEFRGYAAQWTPDGPKDTQLVACTAFVAPTRQGCIFTRGNGVRAVVLETRTVEVSVRIAATGQPLEERRFRGPDTCAEAADPSVPLAELPHVIVGEPSRDAVVDYLERFAFGTY